MFNVNNEETTQLTFTCSKSTIETVKKGMKYVKVNNKTLERLMTSFLCLYCYFEHISLLFLVLLLLALNK